MTDLTSADYFLASTNKPRPLREVGQPCLEMLIVQLLVRPKSHRALKVNVNQAKAVIVSEKILYEMNKRKGM